MNQKIVLASRPKGPPTLANFECVEEALPQPGEGDLLIQNEWLSLDPYMRGRMNDGPSYATPVQLGEEMEGETVGVILASRHPEFQPGDRVMGRGLWQTHAVISGSRCRKLPASLTRPSLALGVLGMPGVTAYTGMKNIGRPQPGETVVVAAASGAVGAVVGQLARIQGCRVVGIAGTAEKCNYVVQELGFDVCLNHRDPDLAAQLKNACPQGVDVYFENVGGAVFDAVFPLLNNFARIPVCGLISFYNATELPAGPDRTPLMFRAALTKRLTIRGFIVWDFADQEAEALEALGGWIDEGKLKFQEHVIEGLEQAPQGLIDLLNGKNFGKVVVRISPEAK